MSASALPPAVHLDVSPGNGTRYSLIVVSDPYGGDFVLWPGFTVVLRCFSEGREVFPLTRSPKLGKVDLAAIQTIVRDAFRSGQIARLRGQ